MDEYENLPAKFAAQGLSATTEKRGSLVARGMAVLRKDNDALYRQAREVFDRRRWNEEVTRNPALYSAFKIFQRLADENYGKALFPLSIFYSDHKDIEDGDALDYKQMAFDWCFANQANQDAELWCDLGKMYCRGRGVKQNIDLALYWAHKSAKQGHVNAQFFLGHMSCMYELGEDIFKEIWEWHQLAAEQGDAYAQDFLGRKYLNGHGVEQNDEQAVYWFRKAAEQGYEYAQCELGQMYREGRGIDPDDEQAVYWFSKAAEQGDEQGQWELGLMYQEGLGVEQNDERAACWFRKAAEQGNDEAQWLLGGMYEYGRGVIPDIEQAEFWYRKSAEQAGEKAQLSLNEMFDAGHGATLNEEQVTYWNIKSAEKGHAWAMRNLGLMYQNGLRVEQDDEQAAYWFSKLPNNKNEDILQLNVLLEGLTPEQQKEIIHKAATKLAEQAILRRNERAK